jgi:hypothetical protein
MAIKNTLPKGKSVFIAHIEKINWLLPLPEKICIKVNLWMR